MPEQEYVALAKLRDRGAQGLGAGPMSWKDMPKEVFEDLGIKPGSLLVTMGPYDYVLHFTAPSLDKAMHFGVFLAALGNLQVCTMPGFSSETVNDALRVTPKLHKIFNQMDKAQDTKPTI